MKITHKTLRAWGACWADDRITEMYMRHGITAATPRQIAECEEVLPKHRVWVLCHALAEIDRAALQRWALDVAERALAMVDALGQRSTTALDVARRYLDGHATREEFADAAAADAAVYTAAATYAATYAVAARTVAAARAVAAADAVAAGEAELRAQIAELLALIEEREAQDVDND